MQITSKSTGGQKKRSSLGVGAGGVKPFSVRAGKLGPVHPAYLQRLSFYLIPPDQDITLEEFESFAVDRLKVLKEIDSLKIRGTKPEQMQVQMTSLLSKYLPLAPSDSDAAYEDIRKDVISHFTLRLAYCKPADRQWFIQQERELLRFRLMQFDSGRGEGSLDKFIEDNGLGFPKIDDEEFEELREVLQLTNLSTDVREVSNADSYYKVPFEQALDLIQHRKVYLRGGFAYVHRTALISLVLTDFRRHLSQSLAKAFKALPAINADRRVAALVDSLPTQYLGRDYVPDREGMEIDLKNIDQLAQQSFPLCMERLHSALRSNHHLKHGGRMQYGLFLKGIGVTLEQALQFWGEELGQKGGRNFEKEYAYNIKHNYGMVGKRTSYTPYACEKVINSMPSAGDHHGCPYKYLDKGALKADLMRKGLGGADVNEVLRLSSEGHYQDACRQVFDATHPGGSANSMSHPNKYFDTSIKYLKEKAEMEKTGGAKTGAPAVPTTEVIIY